MNDGCTGIVTGSSVAEGLSIVRPLISLRDSLPTMKCGAVIAVHTDMVLQSLVFLTIWVKPLPMAVEYTVEGVQVKTSFAGKLGMLTRESLTVSRDGHTYKVTLLDAYHSTVGPKVNSFAPGDHLWISEHPRGNHIRVFRKEIRRN